MASLREHTIHMFNKNVSQDFSDETSSDNYEFYDIPQVTSDNDYNHLKNKPKINGKELIPKLQVQIEH